MHRDSCSCTCVPGAYLSTVVCPACCLFRALGVSSAPITAVAPAFRLKHYSSVACLVSRHERLQRRETTTIRGQQRRKGEPRTDHREQGHWANETRVRAMNIRELAMEILF